MDQANTNRSVEHDHLLDPPGREPAVPLARPSIKRGLLGATACSVEDALALRDYEIGLLRRSHRELQYDARTREHALRVELDALRHRVEVLHNGAKQRDEALGRELRRIERAMHHASSPGRDEPRPEAAAAQVPAPRAQLTAVSAERARPR